MGFNHCYIPAIETLQKEFEQKGLEQFVKSYRKYDALTGPIESIYFLEEKAKEYYEEVMCNDSNNTINKL